MNTTIVASYAPSLGEDVPRPEACVEGLSSANRMRKLHRNRIFVFWAILSSLLFTTGTLYAEPYKYLRMTVLELGGAGNSNIKIDKLAWKMGNQEFPLLDLHPSNFISPTLSENAEIRFESSIENYINPAYKILEDDGYPLFFTKYKEGDISRPQLPATFTIEFKQAQLYPTGIILSLVNGVVTQFSCEGSNDTVSWTTLYTSPTLDWNDYLTAERTFSADFMGVVVPADIDSVKPSVPSNLDVDTISATSSSFIWTPSFDSGVGVLFYELFVNGALWKTSVDPMTTLYGLSEETFYSIEVGAVDAYGNRSNKSLAIGILTSSYPVASQKARIGIGLGVADATTKVFKQIPDFTGDWHSMDVADGPFSQVFVDAARDFSHLRFMNSFGANLTNIENWDDRIQVDNPNQIPQYHGDDQLINTNVLSYEWAIYLCNITHTDMWVNVPGNANEDYVKELATLIQDNLDPRLNVYVENGNETWNGGFHVYHDYVTLGQELEPGLNGDYTASLRYTVYKSLKVFQWFNTSFEDPDRVIKVLSGQYVNTYLSGVHVTALKDPVINPNGIFPDYYGFAPYFNLGGMNGDDGFKQMKQGIDDLLSIHQEQYDIWQAENIDLITYESGIGMSIVERSTYNKEHAVYNAYLYFMDRMVSFFPIFTKYDFVGANGNQDGFGIVKYIGQSLSVSHKYRAFLDWLKINGVNNNAIYNDNSEGTLVDESDGVYDVETGLLTLKKVQIGEKYYYMEFQDQGGFNFTVERTEELTGTYSGGAVYHSTTSVLDVPSFFANGILYEIKMLNKKGVFSMVEIEVK